MTARARILELGALLSLALPGSVGAQTGSALARGDSLMAALETTRAIEAYREGLADSPDDPALLWRAARALSHHSAGTTGREGDEPLHREAVELARSRHPRARGAVPATDPVSRTFPL